MKQVKALKISGVEPSVTNIDNGKYTLVRPFLFVFNGEPVGEAKSFLEFVLSPPAQKLLSKEGLVPVLPKVARNNMELKEKIIEKISSSDRPLIDLYPGFDHFLHF